ncbi:MAG: HD domain-containing protein [Bacteriovoracaceae bacterium]|nr:HD domain-containing protein [Bacteriovoracaceae bacterium]
MNIEALENRIRPYYEAQDSGHDWAHIKRVVRTATQLAIATNADINIVQPAAYLHDIVNIPKDHPDRSRASELAGEKAIKILRELQFEEKYFSQIQQAIIEHSYSKGLKPSSLEAACVQDADRLDALGAIGILRCCSVNTMLKSQFYDPEDPFASKRELNDKKWMLDHYEVKLFKLADTLVTEPAKKEAQSRVAFMRNFLSQLKSEI